MSADVMVEIRDLAKRYGSFQAVDSISLSVHAGEIFGVLGVNGAGKTTTLRMMAGVLRPTAGSIKIGGFDIESQAIEAKQITGYIPDRPYLYNKLTGKEFLYFICDLYNVPASVCEERISTLFSEYKLVDWQDELIESYSHGMKQRLATCAALVHRPKLLIVDEPMVGLDPHGAKFLKESFKKYASEGVAILLSTHTLHVAEELADRLVIIDKGKIIAYGTLAEIRNAAGSQNERLEDLFLRLTAAED